MVFLLAGGCGASNVNPTAPTSGPGATTTGQTQATAPPAAASATVPATPLATPGSATPAPATAVPATTTPVRATPTANKPIVVPTISGGSSTLDLVEAAKRDLAKRLGLATYRVTVVEVSEVEWPDSSLGCPEPGKVYAQVITPGERIILAVDQKNYEYHTDLNGRVVYCQRP